MPEQINFSDICASLLSDQAETVSRRVEKFAELMQSVWISKNDYERRVRAVCIMTYSQDKKSLLTVHSAVEVSCRHTD